MADGITPFSLLVKPASADCNLRCRYCFYIDRCRLYPATQRHRMPDDVLEAMIRSYMSTPQSNYSFGWQGGEPTLMGVDFFRRVVALQQKHGKPGASVSNGLQTNATLIDEELAEHLARYHFLAGVSLDGPADVHDLNRKTAGGGGSHDAVLRGIEILRRHGVETNVLTLVNRANVNMPHALYAYLLDMGVFYHQYVECVEFDSEGRLLPFAIDGESWGAFLRGIFDAWYPRDVRRVSIRLFDAIITRIVDNQIVCCPMGRDCRAYFVVEYNGDIYPCDFSVREELRLGNVLDDNWAALQQCDTYRAFGARKRQWHPACEVCEFARFCAGDCPKNRRGNGNGAHPERLSALCAGWRTFYAHALPRMRELAQEIVRERRRMSARVAAPSAPGAVPPARNGPCPCGSGRKFKHCCGKL